jgi:hypothetical protein
VKKLVLVISSLVLATGTAFACPHGEKSETAEAAPKTAKAPAKTQDKAKAKPAEKPAPANTAKPAADKKAEKVSQK